MKIGIPKETRPGEARVAGTPDTVKKLSKLGFQVVVERGAGRAASFPDDVPEASFSRSAAAIRPPGSRSTAASALDSSGTPARNSER